ncbi:MAG: ABC transporter permease [Cellulosilyticaceae bacterium]
MNILKEYTLDYLKKNKKCSLATMIAIFIAATLLCSVCIFEYTIWSDAIDTTIQNIGDWHGELFFDTPAEKLPYIMAHPNVEKVMMKGPWECGKVEDSKRPYMIMRGANREYWELMGEKNIVTEGKIPQKIDEIVVSKQFFEVHPNVKVGDSIQLEVGMRMQNGELIEANTAMKKDEIFKTNERKNFRIVGVLDMTTSSIIPGYYAMGYLDETIAKQQDKMVMYIHFKNPRTVYKDLPSIAKSLGQLPDEYGEYSVRYNQGLLSKMFIFPKVNREFKLSDWIQPITYILMGTLIMGVFVLIIHNSFAMSASARIKQLGMFRSIGATPKQIRRSVIYEGMLLAIIPTPLGIATGYGLCRLLFNKVNQIQQGIMDDYYPVTVTIGWPVIVVAIIMILVTVWLSAFIPTRKIVKMTPIETIRQSSDGTIKKVRKHLWAEKIFGFEGYLAIHGLRAHRKSFKTAIISLTLSFLLLSVILSIQGVSEASKTAFGKDFPKYPIQIFIKDGNPIDPKVLERIRKLPNIEKSVFYSTIRCATWVSEEDESETLRKLGGLKKIADSGRYTVFARDGKYRINVPIVGMDDVSFKAYCDELGINAKDYYDTQKPKSIVVNQVTNQFGSERRNPQEFEYLSIKVGDLRKVSEKTSDSMPGDYEFTLRTGFITNKSPETVGNQNNYSLVHIMPIGVYEAIVNQFDSDRIPFALRTNATIFVPEQDILRVRELIKAICKSTYGTGDYDYVDTLLTKAMQANEERLMLTIIYGISGLLAVIGITNAFTTVVGSLLQRKREFVMLLSTGLSPNGMRKILCLEALFFAMTPIAIGIPILVPITMFFLKMHGIYGYEYLPYMPLKPIIIFMILTIFAVGLAYYWGSRQIKQGSVSHVIKDETL